MATNNSKIQLPLKWQSQSPAETQAWGARLARTLKPPRVIALVGDLGAGKTCLVKGMAKGFQVKNLNLVNSPTFTLINEYKGKFPVYHMDLYRLNSEEEFCELGYEDYFYGNGITIVEWAERIEGLLPNNMVAVQLTVTGETQRDIQCLY